MVIFGRYLVRRAFFRCFATLLWRPATAAVTLWQFSRGILSRFWVLGFCDARRWPGGRHKFDWVIFCVEAASHTSSCAIFSTGGFPLSGFVLWPGCGEQVGVRFSGANRVPFCVFSFYVFFFSRNQPNWNNRGRNGHGCTTFATICRPRICSTILHSAEPRSKPFISVLQQPFHLLPRWPGRA